MTMKRGEPFQTKFVGGREFRVWTEDHRLLLNDLENTLLFTDEFKWKTARRIESIMGEVFIWAYEDGKAGKPM